MLRSNPKRSGGRDPSKPIFGVDWPFHAGIRIATTINYATCSKLPMFLKCWANVADG